jgi:hypothetical protein
VLTGLKPAEENSNRAGAVLLFSCVLVLACSSDGGLSF